MKADVSSFDPTFGSLSRYSHDQCIVVVAVLYSPCFQQHLLGPKCYSNNIHLMKIVLNDYLCVLQSATSAPLVEKSIERATGIVYNITGGAVSEMILCRVH